MHEMYYSPCGSYGHATDMLLHTRADRMLTLQLKGTNHVGVQYISRCSHGPSTDDHHTVGTFQGVWALLLMVLATMVSWGQICAATAQSMSQACRSALIKGSHAIGEYRLPKADSLFCETEVALASSTLKADGSIFKHARTILFVIILCTASAQCKQRDAESQDELTSGTGVCVLNNTCNNMAMSAFGAVRPVFPKNVAFDGSTASLLTAYWDPMGVLINPHTANPLLCSTTNPNQAVCQDVIPEPMRVGTNLTPFATPWCTDEPLTEHTARTIAPYTEVNPREIPVTHLARHAISDSAYAFHFA